MRKRSLLTGITMIALASACGTAREPAAPSPDAPGSGMDQPPSPQHPHDPFADFDREQARMQARALLGRDEAELEPAANLRIVRRGDEHRPVTMDLRPGRMNVELDDDGTGRFVVTRVMVETPDDELVVE